MVHVDPTDSLATAFILEDSASHRFFFSDTLQGAADSICVKWQPLGSTVFAAGVVPGFPPGAGSYMRALPADSGWEAVISGSGPAYSPVSRRCP